MDHDHDAQQNDKCGCGYKKLVHRFGLDFLFAKTALFYLIGGCDHLFSRLTSLPVRGEHFRYGGGVSLGGKSEHFLNCTRDSIERNLPVEKCLNGNFIGGIKRDGMGSANLRRFKCEPQAGKALEVGRLE